MRKIEDFAVGDVWITGDGERLRVIAVDLADRAYPVVTRAADGAVQTFSATGQFSESPGVFDLISKAPKELVKTLCLFRNAAGEEIIMGNNTRPRLTGYELVSVANVTFVEGRTDG